jgi:TIR domain
MSESPSRPRLRIVRVHDTEGGPSPKSTVMPTRQPMLFSDASAYTLGFIKAGELDAERLVSLIEDAKPRLIFDLRPAPSFARGSIQRRFIFSLFEKYRVQYFDVAGVLGITATRDGLLNPALLIHALQVNILRTTKGLSGPVFFFIDDDLFNEDYFTAIASGLSHQDGRGWDIACWPNDPKPNTSTSRELIFVSHANPEDNEIAIWISARLAAYGYQVWSDVTRLIGGEVIWDTIEQAIRQRAAKVIVLLSKRGHQKPGLLDEVNVAVATERAEGLSRFVIPIRIDDLPFTAVRANLARKNVIDGSVNLADALRAVLKVLKDDGVPQRDRVLDVSDWTSNPTLPSGDTQWDLLFENRIEIKRWPSAIRKFWSGVASADLPFINQSVSSGNVTFESWSNVSRSFGGQVQKVGETLLAVGDWPASNDLVFSDRGEMRRALASLARQAWDRYCASIGMSSYPLANRSLCWFLKNNAQTGNRVRFKDHQGVERTKALSGRSPRRSVYWHFAIEARPNIGDGSLRLVPHVLFSDDGITPIPGADRQHSLRRGFCRSWWNARWRDLLIAILAHMSRGDDSIRLPVSEADAITVSARLAMYDAAIEGAVHRHGLGSSETQLLSFREPEVAVGYKQTSDYPKEGLLQFGPVPFHRNPIAIRVGVIGTREGIELFHRWSTLFNMFRRAPVDVRNSLPFPGFEAVFGAKWPKEPMSTIVLSRTDVVNSILLQDRHQAVYKTSGLFAEAIGNAVKSDDVNVDIWYVIIPDEVYVYGRPESRVPRAIAIATPSAMGRYTARRFTEESPSLFPEDNAEALIYDHHLDFHHQLKERLLAVQAVTQVLRESSLATVTSSVVDNPMLVAETEPLGETTADPDWQDSDAEPVLAGEEFDGLEKVDNPIENPSAHHYLPTRRQMQDPASFAWNIGTTTFFKAGGRPWRVASARDGVCYIGLIFKRDVFQTRQACCGAQMFLDDSDGLVFKGAMGPWYSPETGQFHLDRAEAARLIKMVVGEYQNERACRPKEIFIHGKTRFNEEEWLGFCDAVDLKETKLTAVRITRSNEYKLYSSGELAVKRGTALKLTSRLGLLWTSGYIARLGTYPGRETPNPLRVEIVRDSFGAAAIELVMQDIMALTKMNFNSCIYADGVPVTLRFADAIGDVLVAAKDKSVPPLPFRYYI